MKKGGIGTVRSNSFMMHRAQSMCVCVCACVCSPHGVWTLFPYTVMSEECDPARAQLFLPLSLLWYICLPPLGTSLFYNILLVQSKLWHLAFRLTIQLTEKYFIIINSIIIWGFSMQDKTHWVCETCENVRINVLLRVSAKKPYKPFGDFRK